MTVPPAFGVVEQPLVVGAQIGAPLVGAHAGHDHVVCRQVAPRELVRAHDHRRFDAELLERRGHLVADAHHVADRQVRLHRRRRAPSTVDSRRDAARAGGWCAGTRRPGSPARRSASPSRPRALTVNWCRPASSPRRQHRRRRHVTMKRTVIASSSREKRHRLRWPASRASPAGSSQRDVGLRRALARDSVTVTRTSLRVPRRVAGRRAERHDQRSRALASTANAGTTCSSAALLAAEDVAFGPRTAPAASTVNVDAGRRSA